MEAGPPGEAVVGQSWTSSSSNGPGAEHASSSSWGWWGWYVLQVAVVGALGLEGQFLHINFPSSTDGRVFRLMAGMGQGRHFDK